MNSHEEEQVDRKTRLEQRAAKAIAESERTHKHARDMGSLNKAILIGNLIDDPEMRRMPDGKPTAVIGLATTDAWKDKASGEEKEWTEWHRVVFVNGMAGVVGEHLKKGSQVYVEGKLYTRKWTDINSVDRYSTEIVGKELKVLGKMPAGDVQSASAEGALPTCIDHDGELPF